MKTIKDEFKYLNDITKDKDGIKAIKKIEEEIKILKSKDGLKKIFEDKKLHKIKAKIEYEEELKELQVELIKLQNWAYENKKRVMIIFEGRDAAGKGGAIKRFTLYFKKEAPK